jgi:hypothetical protein
VRLDETYHYVATRFQLTLRGLKHRVGLADARTHPEKNLELAASALRFLFLNRGEQQIRISLEFVSHSSRRTAFDTIVLTSWPVSESQLG